MTVMIVEAVSPTLRGQLTRWLLEPSTGVFVGSISARVRELLWESVCKQSGDGGAVLVHAAANEQGFQIHTWGKTKRLVDDFDGLQLIRLPKGATTNEKDRGSDRFD